MSKRLTESGWGDWETKFVVSGHEVIGKVVEVGSAVKEFKVGERVGVGAQVGSCGKCKACKHGNGEFLVPSSARALVSIWTYAHVVDQLTVEPQSNTARITSRMVITPSVSPQLPNSRPVRSVC